MANEYGTKPWNHRPLFNTAEGVATDLIAGGIATQALVICNEDTTNSVRVRFDGEDADATFGFLLLPGQRLYFANGEVPAYKVSGFSANAVAMTVHYIQ